MWNQFRGDRRNSGMCRDRESLMRPREDWVADLVGPVRGSPVLDRDSVYVGTTRGNLYAFNRDTGHRRWVHETMDAVESTPAVTRDCVYCGLADGTVVAIDSTTGDVRWDVSVQAPLAGALTVTNTPDGVLYVGHQSGLSAFDAVSGDELWTHDTDKEVVGSPAVSDDLVIAGSKYGAVFALEAETGDEVWTAPTDGVPVCGPTATTDRIYVADDDGTMIAMATDTGQSWFTYEIDAPFTATPTVVEDAAFVPAADGYLHVTDTTFGRRLLRGWLFAKRGIALDGIPTGSPVVVGDRLCLSDSSGSLYAVDVTDPDFVWHYPIDDGPVGHLAVGDERLYAATIEGNQAGQLYCFRVIDRS